MRMHTPASRRDTALIVEPELAAMMANPVLPKRGRVTGGSAVNILVASGVLACPGGRHACTRSSTESEAACDAQSILQWCSVWCWSGADRQPGRPVCQR